MKTLDRVMSQVSETASGCWQWSGRTLSTGYGQTWGFGRFWQVHRLVYTEMVADIPEGLQLDHLCRNQLCVNPSHLDPVTPRVNTLRSQGVTAQNARKTHCSQGHEFTEENTYVTQKRHGRQCRTCKRANGRRYDKKRRAGGAR